VADQREAILSRLVAVCGAVSGINAVGRNRLDVGAMLRPAVIILDGSESFVDAPDGIRIDVIQRMELSPAIVLALRADDGAEAGTLMALYAAASSPCCPMPTGGCGRATAAIVTGLHGGAASRSHGTPARHQHALHLRLPAER
jgi:hypothetical protein